MYGEKPTVKEMQDYLVSIRPTWRKKVYSMPEYQLYSVYNRFKNEEKKQIVKEILSQYE